MMEKKDTSQKIRRPLPTPGATPAQRPNTPVQSSSPVPPGSFYGLPSQKLATIPDHPQPGSGHTTYLPPSDPPSYASTSQSGTSSFPEPQLMVEDSVMQEDDIVGLMHPDGTQHSTNDGDNNWNNSNWNSDIAKGWAGDDSMWNNYGPPPSAWTDGGTNTLGLEPLDYLSASKDTEIQIDGRSNYEELNWWDAAVRQNCQRPGPGMLPPVLSDELHDADHSLFSVTVTPPNIPLPVTTPTSTETKPNPPIAPSGLSQDDASASSTTIAASVQPTEEDVRTAVPHPNAYYCPRENGWVILSWKSSSVSPPLAKSFVEAPHTHLPDLNRRKRIASCIGDGEQSFGQYNKTHHFHKYERAIDAHKLTPSFRRDEWDQELLKIKRRTQRVVDNLDLQELQSLEDVKDEEELTEGKLLDLYVCCQCSFYCVASGIIPGVIPRKYFDEFVRDRRENPPPGKNGEQAVVQAFETILLAIENKLWRAENRMLRVARSSFRNKVGWNSNIKRVFEVLGFIEETYENDLALKPPVTDTSTAEGKQNRKKLLRVWVEIGAWVSDYRRRHVIQLKDTKAHKLFVKIESAREMYQSAIGAHPDQIPRGELQGPLLAAVQTHEKAWRELGLTPMSYSADLLAFGYLAQCRCDPAGTVNYFTQISNLVRTMQEMGGCPASLQDLMVMERSRDRFVAEDIISAAETLGFGVNGPLRVEYDETDVPDEFIESAWRECIKRSWRDPAGSTLQREATDAFRILAESRGSTRLRQAWESSKSNLMTPERAYSTLEIPKDVDENMLITVFTMRLEEQPMQMDKMREALLVIAEVRNSERLRQFLLSGQDPGDIIGPTPPDMPRGLNQLGNTCYLNSLLQYFYTIKDLREAVMPMSKLDLGALEEEKLTDDDLKRHRVGGRLVTRREILRSKRFIHQLAELFFNLEYCEAASVTPTIELAKLALVTSRDEEDDEADKGGTDSSNDTEATLVDDGPSRPSVTETSLPSPDSVTNAVLGKRSRDVILRRNSSEMDVDSSAPDSPKDGGSFITAPSSASSLSPPPQGMAGSSRQPDPSAVIIAGDGNEDVEMEETPSSRIPPPLPPRKPVVKSDSVMMFGKQHDVAECMDNCMFQIETALLNFGDKEKLEGDGEKTSVVKRLFYGKILQRLTDITDQKRSRSSVHEKEDLFSHLPVNVIHDGVDIYDGLSGYFDDVVEYEGKKTRMEVSLVDVPPLLQIQLQRVQFNRDTLQPYKSQAYVKFGETIYLDRFMHNANPQKKARAKAVQAELTACRERLRLLVEGKNGPHGSSLDYTHTFLSRLDGIPIPGLDADLLLHLGEEIDFVRREIDDLRQRSGLLKTELESIWQDDMEVAYELTSVFIHRGSSPSWGHYFFYSRHLPDSPDSWFKYNDSDVTVVTKDEVLADTTGSTANPYLLVFARKGSQLVDTVKRFDHAIVEEQ
ncbi:hypothetical protein AX17_000828 [Amanita inopinata Kibby_2008]|nr:hypothetical protein AX17_000828 [Amanita inopinata Kibby_2008]